MTQAQPKPNSSPHIGRAGPGLGGLSGVHQLDDDISHVQMLLDELRRKRELLPKFITEHNAILTPIRRLPAEILAEIFVLCMNSDISSFAPTQSPLLVGQVCKVWRQVALSTQTLWSSIVMCWAGPKAQSPPKPGPVAGFNRAWAGLAWSESPKPGLKPRL